MEFDILDLGLVDFKKAWQIQKIIFEEIRDCCRNSTLVLCQHYPVITLGRQGSRSNILRPAYELAKSGIQVYEIERGGDVTYHDQGQINIYPVFDLKYLKKDIHWFLRQLEEAVINFLTALGVGGQRRPGLTGVWVEEKKIASIGIAIKNWISFHGLSINIKKNELANFCLVRPCGMDIGMTSLETVLNKNIEVDEIKAGLIHNFINLGGNKND